MSARYYRGVAAGF